MRYTFYVFLLLILHLGLSTEARADSNYRACLDGLTFACDETLLSQDQQQNIFAQLGSALNTNPTLLRTCEENGSCYGDISALTGRPKTVQVDGYFRKDGTYVRGHYRSKPKN
jgi:hypothetical protein